MTPQRPKPQPTPQPTPAAAAPAAKPNVANAQQATDRLLALWPLLPAETRATIAQQLADAGIAPGTAAEQQRQAARPALRELCDVDANAALPPGGVQDVLAAILGSLRPIEHLSWATWRQIAPQSALRSSGDLCAILGRSLATPSDDTRRIAAAELKKVGQLIAAIISAVPAATQVAIEHWQQLMPRDIRLAVEASAGSRGQAGAARCWEKYEALANAFEAEELAGEVRRTVALHVDRLVNSGGF